MCPKFFKKEGLARTKARIGNLPFFLFILALAVRLPWLWEVPRYIDELKEVNLAYRIYSEHLSPLHNMAHEIGALHNYILAAGFGLFGPNIFWPRFYVALTSSLTVVLVYFLGRRLYGRWVGVTAASLILGNGMHILVTHMAWSNCTTPFFFVVAVLTLTIAEQERDGRWLVFSAFCWGLALQTHSSVLVYLLPAVIYVSRPSFYQKTLIERRYFILAIMAFCIAYVNMIYYNLISGGGSLYNLHKSYTVEPHPGFVSFLGNWGQMVIELLRALTSIYQNYQQPWLYLLQPLAIIGFVLLGAGIYYAVKERRTLLLWLLAGGFLVIPWINDRYNYYIVTRYIMPVMIAALILTAHGLISLLRKIGRRNFLFRQRTAGLALLCIGLVTAQLFPFYNYCRTVSGSNMSNHLSLAIVHLTQRLNSRGQALIFIDPKLNIENNPLPILLNIQQEQVRTLPVSGSGLSFVNLKETMNGAIVVATPTGFSHLKQFLKFSKVQRVYEHLILNTKTDRSIRTVYVAQIK